MNYTVYYTQLFAEEFEEHLAYAVEQWGKPMLRAYRSRLEELEQLLAYAPYTFEASQYHESQQTRKVRFYGPLVLYYDVNDDTMRVTFLRLWHGRQGSWPNV